MQKYGAVQPREEKQRNNINIDVKKICIVVLSILCIIAIVYVVLHNRNNMSVTTEIHNNNLSFDTNAMSDNAINVFDDTSFDNMVVFQGYDDMEVSIGQGIRLSNSPSNVDIYIKYSIIDSNGNVVCDTGLIMPGEYVRCVLSDYLESGEYALYFKQEAYSMDSNGNFQFITDASSVVNTILG